jgi:hypothetical protein
MNLQIIGRWTPKRFTVPPLTMLKRQTDLTKILSHQVKFKDEIEVNQNAFLNLLASKDQPSQSIEQTPVSVSVCTFEKFETFKATKFQSFKIHWFKFKF